MVQEFYDQVARGYDGKYQRPVDLVENELVFGRLGRYFHGHALDLGCATGLILDYVDFDGYVGVDFSGQMIAHAQRKNSTHYFAQMEITRALETMTGFDLVLSTFGALNYIDLASWASEIIDTGDHVFICVYGNGYLDRENYIAHGVLNPNIYTSDQLQEWFPGAKIWGMNYGLDNFNFLGRRLLKLLARLQLPYLRRNPDKAYWLIAET